MGLSIRRGGNCCHTVRSSNLRNNRGCLWCVCTCACTCWKVTDRVQSLAACGRRRASSQGRRQLRARMPRLAWAKGHSRPVDTQPEAVTPSANTPGTAASRGCLSVSAPDPVAFGHAEKGDSTPTGLDPIHRRTWRDRPRPRSIERGTRPGSPLDDPDWSAQRGVPLNGRSARLATGALVMLAWLPFSFATQWICQLLGVR